MSTIIRWNPIREMAAMQSAMDRIFDNTWRSFGGLEGVGSALALDVHENDQQYSVTTALPGLKPEQIEITLHDGTLTISGEYERAQTDENTRVLIQERSYGKFSRSITLPQAVDADNVQAQFDNGVLTLTLPKTAEAQPRRISVSSSPALKSGK